jgi:hypothetical protein
MGNLAVNAMTEPWQCPSCGAEHHCGEATPANVHGSTMSGKDLRELIQRAVLRGR